MTKKSKWVEVDRRKRWAWSCYTIIKCHGGGYLLSWERVNQGLFDSFEEAKQAANDHYRWLPNYF